MTNTELIVSDELKYGKQEILLDPTKEVSKCGYKITALTANDLMLKKEDGTFIKLTDWILQEKIEIARKDEPIVDGQTIKFNWTGTNDVLIYIDNDVHGLTPSGNKEHVQPFLPGTHKVVIQCTRDRRGLTYTVNVPDQAGTITVTYGGEA